MHIVVQLMWLWLIGVVAASIGIVVGAFEAMTRRKLAGIILVVASWVVLSVSMSLFTFSINMMFLAMS
jgi:hypothetical protein